MKTNPHEPLYIPGMSLFPIPKKRRTYTLHYRCLEQNSKEGHSMHGVVRVIRPRPLRHLANIHRQGEQNTAGQVLYVF
jgi:hypothetical protein